MQKKLFLLCFIFITIGSLVGCSNSINKETSVDISDNQTLVSETKESEDTSVLNDKWDKDHINDDDFKWLHTENWDKIIITNACTDKSVEVTNTEFLDEFKLHSMLFKLVSYEPLGEFDYGKGQPYVYKFIKDNQEYEIQAITEDIALINNKYYKCYNLQALGNAFSPATEYQKVENVLSKIYNSDLYYFAGYSFQPKHGNLIVQYIVREQRKNKLKVINSLPTIKFKKKSTVRFYWHGEVITMNVYKDVNKEYIEIIDGNKNLIYEQNHTEYSILNNFGV